MNSLKTHRNDNNTKWLTVKANIIDKAYLIGRKVGDGFKKSMRILFDDHLGHWNYVAVPQHG
jgi:hypothetical protein